MQRRHLPNLRSPRNCGSRTKLNGSNSVLGIGFVSVPSLLGMEPVRNARLVHWLKNNNNCRTGIQGSQTREHIPLAHDSGSTSLRTPTVKRSIRSRTRSLQAIGSASGSSHSATPLSISLSRHQISVRQFQKPALLSFPRRPQPVRAAQTSIQLLRES